MKSARKKQKLIAGVVAALLAVFSVFAIGTTVFADATPGPPMKLEADVYVATSVIARTKPPMVRLPMKYSLRKLPLLAAFRPHHAASR